MAASTSDAVEQPLAVVVDDVFVEYRSETSGPEREAGSRWSARLGHFLGRPRHTTVRALNGVSFQVREGEHVGIVGANGSGKSTLMRLIAGVETPTGGSVLASDVPVLLGVNAALLPKLSGRKNVRLGLLALGYSPDEVSALAPGIIELAGLGEAIDRPMNTYSSGMGARLRFAIAASAQPRILLIDEALGTGDAAFASRSERAINKLRANAGAIFLVSHAAKTIEDMCSRAIWLNHGDMILDGPASEVARAYRWFAHQLALDETEAAERLLQAAASGNPVIPPG